MANAPKRRQLTPDKPAALKHQDPKSSTARGYCNKWRVASKQFREKHPLCVHCQAKGVIRIGDCVDHIRPHRGDKSLFWDVMNWQTLCNECHTIKTVSGQ